METPKLIVYMFSNNYAEAIEGLIFKNDKEMLKINFNVYFF